MTEKRFVWNSKEVMIDDNVAGNQLEVIDITEIDILIDLLNALYDENEELKQSNERIVNDIDLALGFIKHKGYSLRDIKDYEDAKKKYEEDLANYRKR